MGQRPTIQGVKLEPCCKDTLKDIDERIYLSKVLSAFLAGSPFITMFGANPIGVVFTITTTDWDLLVNATKQINPLAKRACHTVAQTHSYHHSGPLCRFWEAMAESFV